MKEIFLIVSLNGKKFSPPSTAKIPQILKIFKQKKLWWKAIRILVVTE